MNIPSERTQYGNPGSATDYCHQFKNGNRPRRLMTLTLIVIVSERQQQGMNYVYTREF